MPKDLEQQDPERDRKVTQLLESVEAPSASTSDFENDALRTRIVAAAHERLEARSGGHAAWWMPLARWTRPALPVGAVACLLLVTGLFLFEPPTRETSPTATIDASGELPAETWTTYLTTTDATDPAAELLAAQSRSDFLTAVLEYPTGPVAGTSR
jgi:hypothetical protein